MKKNSVLVLLLLIGMLGVALSPVFADSNQNCGSNHSLIFQKGVNNQFSKNCNNNSNQNTNSNSQSQSQTQNNDQNVTISAPLVAAAPVVSSLPSTGTSPMAYSLFGFLPLGFILRKFA